MVWDDMHSECLIVIWYEPLRGYSRARQRAGSVANEQKLLMRQCKTEKPEQMKRNFPGGRKRQAGQGAQSVQEEGFTGRRG